MILVTELQQSESSVVQDMITEREHTLPAMTSHAAAGGHASKYDDILECIKQLLLDPLRTSDQVVFEYLPWFLRISGKHAFIVIKVSNPCPFAAFPESPFSTVHHVAHPSSVGSAPVRAKAAHADEERGQ